MAAILLILGGISLVGYPWISDWCYRVHTQSSVAVYAAEAKEQSDVKAQLMQDAIAYNTWLSEAHITLSDPFSGAQIVEKPELPYTSQLALDDSGILAFIEIPKIHVYLSVYHTTSAEVLQRGAGHMEGTALPVGGAGNRPVISAHSGMNRAQMFSDLSDLETGDLFLIHVLDETLTYQVVYCVRTDSGQGSFTVTESGDEKREEQPIEDASTPDIQRELWCRRIGMCLILGCICMACMQTGKHLRKK